jgi:hypothetical protein
MLSYVVLRKIWTFIPSYNLLTSVVRVSKDINLQVLEEMGIRRIVVSRSDEKDEDSRMCEIVDKFINDPYIIPPKDIWNCSIVWDEMWCLFFEVKDTKLFRKVTCDHENFVIMVRSMIRVTSTFKKWITADNELWNYSINRDPWIYIKLSRRYLNNPEDFIKNHLDYPCSSIELINYMRNQVKDPELKLCLDFRIIAIKYGLVFLFDKPMPVRGLISFSGTPSYEHEIIDNLSYCRASFIKVNEDDKIKFSSDRDVLKCLIDLWNIMISGNYKHLRMFDVIMFNIIEYNCIKLMNSIPKSINPKMEGYKVIELYLKRLYKQLLIKNTRELRLIFENIKIGGIPIKYIPAAVDSYNEQCIIC